MACCADWLAAHVERHGPYVHHMTEPVHYASIVRQGLLPFDVVGRISHDGPYRPRPGHIYFQQAMDISDRGVLAVRIDLRDIEPVRINPDEDAFWAASACINEVSLDATQYGLDDPLELVATDFNDLDPATCKYTSYGQWANENHVGDDSKVTHLAVATTQTLAIRGAIGPELLDFFEFDLEDFIWQRKSVLTPV